VIAAWLLEYQPPQLQITDEVIEEVRAFRKEIGVGVQKTTVMLRNRRRLLGLPALSERQMRELFRTHDLWTGVARPAAKPAEHLSNYVAQFVGAIWHVDLKGPIFVDGVRGFLFCLIDDRSRFIVHIGFIERKTAENTCEQLRLAIEKWGPPYKLVRDGGREFWAEFQHSLEGMGVRIWTTNPYSPEQNGKIERFWRTLFELIRKRLDHAANEPYTMELILRVVQTYNDERPHSSLVEITGETDTTPGSLWTQRSLWAAPGAECPENIIVTYDRDVGK
jgi:transposase InsO family protein